MKKIASIMIVSMLLFSMILIVPLIHADTTVWTDKADYVPEETVTIYGSGFDSVVSITVTRPDGSADCWAVTPDSGSFTTCYQLDGIEGTYIIDATDGVNTATTTFTDVKPPPGTTLLAEVTATAYWTRTFHWTIDKSVDPDYWEFYPGDSGTSTYTITVTKDSGTDHAWVEGIVTVTNGGVVGENPATENLAIAIRLRDGLPPPDDLIATATVDVSGNPVLDPQETGYYPYSIDIPSVNIEAGGLYKITADVTITNHAGHIGTPFGPSPSATTNLPSSPTLINDEIHVDDTNGGSWTFDASSSITYDKTFVYCQEGEHKNTATIRETGQSDEATVTVVCLKPPAATIAGVKYYDSNLNCERDTGESGLEGWTIQLWKQDGTWTLVQEVQTGSAGAYLFEVTEAGHYKVMEVKPAMWVQTEPEAGYYEFDVELGKDYGDNDFGNVKLVPGKGGLTLGFWSNKNGQALITDSDITFLNGLNLYKPTGWSYPPFTTKKQIATYLLSATAVDMRWMLSAQLIATELDVIHGFLSASTMVYVGPSIYVPFPGFISIGNIMNKANTALLGTDRDAQTYWKCLLDGVNNNRLPFLSP